MKTQTNINIRNAFSLGYYISLVNDYFRYSSVKGISEINNDSFMKTTLDLLLGFQKEYRVLIKDDIVIFPNLESSEKIIEYFECFYAFLKNEVTKKCPGIIQISFYLGGVIAIMQLSGPHHCDPVLLNNILFLLFEELNSDSSDFNIKEVIEDLSSFNIETRRKACDILLFLIFDEKFVEKKIPLISDLEKTILNSVY